jgi:hypothetical protein
MALLRDSLRIDKEFVHVKLLGVELAGDFFELTADVLYRGCADPFTPN